MIRIGHFHCHWQWRWWWYCTGCNQCIDLIIISTWGDCSKGAPNLLIRNSHAYDNIDDDDDDDDENDDIGGNEHDYDNGAMMMVR